MSSVRSMNWMFTSIQNYDFAMFIVHVDRRFCRYFKHCFGKLFSFQIRIVRRPIFEAFYLLILFIIVIIIINFVIR